MLAATANITPVMDQIQLFSLLDAFCCWILHVLFFPSKTLVSLKLGLPHFTLNHPRCHHFSICVCPIKTTFFSWVNQHFSY